MPIVKYIHYQLW